MATREIERASDHDPELLSIRECFVNGKWYKLPYKEYLPVRNELSAMGKPILPDMRRAIPKALREKCRRWNVDGSILPEGGSGETNHHDTV